MFEAILWDNDGVLVDTERLYFEATARVLAPVGVTLTRDDYVEYFLRQNVGAWHLAEARGVSPEETRRMRKERDALYLELIGREPTIIAGVREALDALSGRFRMAIVTSSQPAPFARIHEATGILHHFEFALTRVDYAESKPSPEPYLLGVSRLCVANERCLVIEDSERGLTAAKAAGLACWVVPSELSRGSCFDAADRVLPDLAAVVRALSA